MVFHVAAKNTASGHPQSLGFQCRLILFKKYAFYSREPKDEKERVIITCEHSDKSRGLPCFNDNVHNISTIFTVD
jgi:hypothetical protein